MRRRLRVSTLRALTVTTQPGGAGTTRRTALRPTLISEVRPFGIDTREVDNYRDSCCDDAMALIRIRRA